MYAANNTLEETIGLATAANTILQNPQSVGTTLKTVSMYVRAAKTELEEAGEETDGIAESTGKLREIIMAITREGGRAVDIMADENRFKSTYQILEEISEVWDRISDTNQAALLEKLGGKRNANAIAAILENFSIAREAMEAASNAEGSALTELSKYQESIEGHMVALKTAFQELSSAVIDSDLVKTVIDIGRYILEFLTGVVDLIDKLGGLKTVLLSIVSIGVAQFFSNFSQSMASVSSAASGLLGMLGSVKTGFMTMLSTGTLAFAGLSVVIGAAIGLFKEYKQQQEEVRRRTEELANAAKEEDKEIFELVKKYDELNESVKKDSSLADELLATEEELNKKFGTQSKSVNVLAKDFDKFTKELKDNSSLTEKMKSDRDRLIDAFGTEIGAVDNLAGAYENLTNKMLQNRAVSELEKNRTDLNAEYNQKGKELLEAARTSGANYISGGGYSVSEEAAIKYMQDLGYINSYTKNLFGGIETILPSFDLTSVEGVIDAYDTLNKMLEVLNLRGLEHSDLFNNIYAVYANLTPKIEAYRQVEKALNENLFDTVYIQKVLGKALPETEEDFEKLRGAMIDTIRTSGKYVGSVNEIGRALDEFLSKDSRFSGFINNVSDSAFDAVPGGSNVAGMIEAYASKLKTLSNAWKEFKENGLIASETYSKLNEEFENESGLVEIVNGKLSLNADAVEKLNDKLRDEYGLKIALAGASEDEIAQVDSLASSLRNLSAEVEDPTASLKELTDVLGKMHEGYELSTFDTLSLIQKYPQLRDKLISTANGYKIEESAIRDLILAKSQLLKLNEREIGVTSAREALVSSRGAKPAEMIEKIFADFEAANGKAITTVEEFAQGYFDEFGRTYENVFTEYEALVNAMIDLNNGLEVDSTTLAMIVEDLNGTVKEGYDPNKKESKTSTKKEETEFEKAYKLHQHYVAMNQETEEQYLNWLDGAYKASYAAGEMELDDYYKYEEEVYEKRKQLFQTSLDEMQHQIDLLSHQTGDTSAEQIAIYEQMQKKVNQQANAYRARGVKENDELIRELQNQWWQYEDNIRQLRESAFNDWLNDKKFVIDRLKQDNASMDEIVGSWKEVLTRINDEIAYYLSKGYDVTSDVIQNLMGELDSAKESIIEALDEVVSKANEVVDGFQNVYQTLANAGKEYASTGYLSVDSLQSILSLGPQYMDMLYDEAGQLTLNEEALQKIIAARTEEMAAETALSYAKQILLATENDETQTLRELSNIQSSAASNTWDVAYATLGYAKAIGATKGISEDYYDKAFENITKMQSVTKTAVDSIGSYYETLQEGYISQADALDQILKLTEDMIKQENSDRIDDLEKEKDLYKDIIDEKKEILRLTKEQNDHDREMADKLKEISDLQSKIDQLALDDSREAGAQRAKLEAELLEKQKALADDQSDYAYDAQVDALDKQYDAFEEEKDDEIDALKDMLSSAEKLYQAAISRINNGWDTLYDDLITWNTSYGSQLNKTITDAWNRALEAAERYGSFVDALEGTKEFDKIGASHVTPETPSARAAYDGGANVLTDYISRMRANSLAWFTSDNQASYASANQSLAQEYKAATGNTLTYKNGSWFQNGSSTPIYTLSADEVGNAIRSAMQANSAAWNSASEDDKRRLSKENEELAKRLAAFTGKPVTKTQAGVWMYGGIPLYSVTKFHTGGIVGGAKTLRQSEVMALLQKGEAVLDEKRETALYKTVDFVQMLSDKIGHAIDRGRLSSLLGGTGASFAASAVPSLAGGIGTMNFSPTIQITFANTGDMSESQARKYGSIAAESALQQLKAAFSQRGVGALGNSTLK